MHRGKVCQKQAFWGQAKQRYPNDVNKGLAYYGALILFSNFAPYEAPNELAAGNLLVDIALQGVNERKAAAQKAKSWWELLKGLTYQDSDAAAFVEQLKADLLSTIKHSELQRGKAYSKDQMAGFHSSALEDLQRPNCGLLNTATVSPIVVSSYMISKLENYLFQINNPNAQDAGLEWQKFNNQ